MGRGSEGDRDMGREIERGGKVEIGIGRGRWGRERGR